MRFGGVATLLFALVACAKGGAVDQQVQSDAPNVQDDAPPADTNAPADAPVDMVEPHHDAPPDSPPDACVPAEVEHLTNPVFDLAPTGVGWTQVPMPDMEPIGGPFPIITSDGITPLSAPNHAWLGGETAADATPPRATISDQLFQDVTFPADTSLVTVSGFSAGQTDEAPGTVFDRFSLDIVQTNGTVIENVLKLDNTKVTASYAPFVKTLSAGGLAQVVGKTVRLRATSTHDDSFVTNFFIDSLSLKATHCP
jgi:hypothetical protein